MDTMVHETVKQYPYRTAKVEDIFLRVPRDSVKDLELQLAEAAGARLDNHTVYEITQEDRSPVYIKFSDMAAIFAHTLREGRH